MTAFNLEALLDWLKEHEIAYEDFMEFCKFVLCMDRPKAVENVLEFITQYKTLTKDMIIHFMGDEIDANYVEELGWDDLLELVTELVSRDSDFVDELS